MGIRDFDSVIREVTRRDARYHRDAYHFVREALDFTQVRQRRSRRPGREEEAHVSAAELLEGIRAYALHQYGPMAKFLFQEWGVFTCEDFGEIVFNMIRCGILRKTEEDRVEDFRGRYTFYDAFAKPFLPQSATPVVLGSAPQEAEESLF